MKGCFSCTALKKTGACKKNQCIDISTKEGQKLAIQAKITQVPQAVCIGKNGKAKKCSPKFMKNF